MSKLLFVASSMFGAESKSGRIAREFVAAWRAAHPEVFVVERDLVRSPIPHLAAPAMQAWATPETERSRDQRQAAAASDALIDELEAADVIVIAAPMYNFSISSNLKAWIDHVTRAGRTFRYTERGAEGLLRGKKVFVVTGRGGIYTGESAMKTFDFQEPYLRAILGFIGLDDIEFIHVEGQRIGPEAAAAGIARARESIRERVPAARAA